MADKLSWNPPKWKSYSFEGTTFKVELETGEIFKRYYERVAKIGNSNISKIYIETEFDVTPKFTI